jgi:hypothetical protein
VSPSYPFAVDLHGCQVSGVPISFQSRRTYGNHGISVLVSGSHGGAEAEAISAPRKLKKR